MATRKVIIELRVPDNLSAHAATEFAEQALAIPGFQMDSSYQPVPVEPPEALTASMAQSGEQLMLVRGELDEAQEEQVKRDSRVVSIWSDAPIAPFEVYDTVPLESIEPDLALVPTANPCPCGPCDCNSSASGAHGDIAAVARYLGSDRLWAAGIRGAGIVIGIVDTGVDRRTVPNVIDGWTPNPRAPVGTDPGGHGTMCAVDALGQCPDARIYDLGVLKSTGGIGGTLSDAITAYNWAITRFRHDGTPHVLSNSWGMYQRAWAADYATNPNHPFTRKVVEAIQTGILVCFAAGNCGEVCPSGRCGGDTGPGRSIWGANGHPLVITVGAANIDNQWIGYTSQGPAALAPDKPDVCAPSHYRGHTANDNGTSAACPTLAGVLGLLRQAKPALRQVEAAIALQSTAFNICQAGWDANSGFGIIRAEAAYRRVVAPVQYPICGTQWQGQVPANSTRRWFTFNWPAHLNVLWTIMPRTPSAGGSQVRWRVQIERASGDYKTYWISVTNLTNRPVDFEGRYCITGAVL
jgi:subtilisin family serine protease